MLESLEEFYESRPKIILKEFLDEEQKEFLKHSSKKLLKKYRQKLEDFTETLT